MHKEWACAEVGLVVWLNRLSCLVLGMLLFHRAHHLTVLVYVPEIRHLINLLNYGCELANLTLWFPIVKHACLEGIRCSMHTEDLRVVLHYFAILRLVLRIQFELW